LKADVRIVAATHRDLNRLVHQGGFREDLFYRLNVVPIRLPPLRERREDIPELTRHFLARAAAEGLRYKVITKAGMDRLQRHDWPGNVRELENTVRRLAALYSEDEIGEAVMARELDTPLARVEAPAGEAETLSASVERHLNRYFTAHAGDLPPAGLYARVLREVERPLITRALSATRGNQIKAAELLGLNRNTLRKKIRELDIEVVRGIK
jgi:two-component system nitrogen regulation response regulator GlnG